jgi:crotonobetainyl-CoA:carnitine CoA-transferase CaiB-like acyl-CoA transferase
MSGILDRARAGDGTPFRVAAPVCAIAAGLAGVLAVLAGLLRPGGWEADISMQDAGAWLTHWEWNSAPAHACVRTDETGPA